MSLPDEINNFAIYLNKDNGELNIGYVLNKSYYTIKLYIYDKDISIDLDKKYKGQGYFLYEDNVGKAEIDTFVSQISSNLLLEIIKKGKEKKQEFTRSRHMMPTPKKPPHPRKGGRKTRGKKKYKKSLFKKKRTKKRKRKSKKSLFKKKRKRRRGYGGTSPKYIYSTQVTIKK